MKYIIIVISSYLLCMVLPLQVFADDDSLAVVSVGQLCNSYANGVEECDKSIASFDYYQTILPAMMIAVGSTGLYVWQVKDFNKEVRSRMTDLSWNRRFRADDYMQYLPVASNIGLGMIGAKAKHSLLDRTIVTATSHLPY